jgi:hypothetical protein
MERENSCGGALLAAAKNILQGQAHGPVSQDAMKGKAQLEIANSLERRGINKSRFPVWQGLWHNASRLALFAEGFNKAF